MKANLRQHLSVSLTLCACLMPLLACGTNPAAPTPFPTLPPSPTSVSLPSFLSYVFPDPGSNVFEVTVSSPGQLATFELAEIAGAGEILKPEDMRERTQFIVDCRVIETTFKTTSSTPGAGQVSMFGSFTVEPGEHQATIRVRRTSGGVLEFSWRFTVITEELTIPGLPEGFHFVRPFPDSTISQRAYREAYLIPPEYAPGFAILQGGVCVGILTRKVVEPGEYLTAEEVGAKYRLVALDGVPPDSDAIIESGTELGHYEIFDPTTCHVVGSYDGLHHYSCWRIDLAPGRHEATVRLERASGEVTEFTWWFVITE